MNPYIFPIFLCLSLMACTIRTDPVEVEIAMQKRNVASAQRMVTQETDRLNTMVDSFQIKVQQNQGLGLPKKKADAIERLLIQTQQAVVEAAKVNLKRQRELLLQLEKQAQTP